MSMQTAGTPRVGAPVQPRMPAPFMGMRSTKGMPSTLNGASPRPSMHAAVRYAQGGRFTACESLQRAYILLRCTCQCNEVLYCLFQHTGLQVPGVQLARVLPVAPPAASLCLQA